MKWTPTKLPRSAPLVLIVLMVGAVAAFAGVSHLVRRFNANRQALGRKLYVQGLADANARTFSRTTDEFRAALSLDPTNSQYHLSLARALRDSGDPRRLNEAESYLLTLWQRALSRRHHQSRARSCSRAPRFPRRCHPLLPQLYLWCLD